MPEYQSKDSDLGYLGIGNNLQFKSAKLIMMYNNSQGK